MNYGLKRHILLDDGSGGTVVPPIDSTDPSFIVIQNDHHEVHEGNSYFAIYSAIKDSAGMIEVRIGIPDSTTRAHMEIDIESSLAATLEIWNPTTKTDVVINRITPLNKDNNSSNTSILTLCHTPDGTQSGTASITEYMGAADTSGRFIASGASNSRGEIILKNNSSYLIRLTSRADANALSIIMVWYEH